MAGFVFADIREYKDAKREAETIEYIKANTDLKDLNKALKLYHKLVERQTLKTIVGLSFLKELQEKILNEGIINKDNLPYIQVEKDNKQIKAYTNSLEHLREDKYQKLSEEYRIRHRNSRIINIFFILIIVAMFMIALLKNREEPQNYENEIINKYSAWEEDLKAREEAIRDKE